MQTALFHLTTVAALSVLAVLLMGLYTMMSNKSSNLSQKLMRWRVGLQFVALLVIMGFIYVAR